MQPNLQSIPSPALWVGQNRTQIFIFEAAAYSFGLHGLTVRNVIEPGTPQSDSGAGSFGLLAVGLGQNIPGTPQSDNARESVTLLSVTVFLTQVNGTPQSDASRQSFGLSALTVFHAENDGTPQNEPTTQTFALHGVTVAP